MKKIILLVFLACIITNVLCAQSLLSSTVTIKAKNQKLHEVLTIMGNESNVTFSYNTKSINRDSLVTLSASNKPLGEVLRMIFNANYEFKESGNYIIIRRKAISISSVVSKSQSKLDYYIINGYVIDDETGDKIADATIYEQQQLISSMSDANGFFSMKLKNKYPSASITVSKNNYHDTSIQIQASYNHKVAISLTRKEVLPILIANEKSDEDDVIVNDKVESKWISNVVLSSKQKLRSLNLKKFYTNRNYQISVWPGIGTHGEMNAQVSNKFSLNVGGGYAGGLNGVEVGLLFNLLKNDMKGTQVAGLFNIVGGKMKGIQVSSLYNEVADSAKGIQVSGLVNIVKEDMKGIQIASLCNVSDNIDGMQISGLVNVAKEDMNGMQIASLINKAKSIHGVQIGLINITDGNEGTSIGLLNISKGKRAKHKIGFIVRLPKNRKNY